MFARRLGRALWRLLSDPIYRRSTWRTGRKAIVRHVRSRRASFHPDPAASLSLNHFLGGFAPSIDADTSEWIVALSARYLEHQFHVLGSGWRRPDPAGPFPGLEGLHFPSGPPRQPWIEAHVTPKNRDMAKRIWALIDAGYHPIDWQLDVKTGFRFSLQPWPLSPKGVDVKAAWELARMQHLPTLALAYRLTGDLRLPREFRNQVLDFTATNPPGLGIHWADGLEAAIRAANLLVTRDLFLAFGATFDAAFETALLRSIGEHAAYLAENLPWDPHNRGNHYLGALAGLFFACAYLPATPETDGWLAFALAEIQAEALHEFQEDGSHFEGATGYHLLCTDILAWSIAWIATLPKERLERIRHIRAPRLVWEHAPARLHWPEMPANGIPLDPRLLRRLPLILSFLQDVTRPDGHVAQIGDFDSGRLFTFGMLWQRLPMHEATSRYRNLRPSAIHAGEWHWEPQSGVPRDVESCLLTVMGNCQRCTVTAQVLRHVMGVALNVEQPLPGSRVPVTGEALSSVEGRLTVLPEDQRVVTRFDAGGQVPLTENLSYAAYPDFGLYIFRSPRLFLTVRCSNGPGIVDRGHAHNDELSVELWIDGQAWVVDPGTYLYNLPAFRARYRSVAAHFAPQLDGVEPRRLDYDCFRFAEPVNGQCLHLSADAFAGQHETYGIPLVRLVRIFSDAVVVTDAALESPPSPLVVGPRDPLPFSPGYGVQERVE